MRDRTWPTFARPRRWSMTTRAHSRGRPSAAHAPFERAPGARWIATLDIIPLSPDQALNFRGFIHSLRGRSGTFFFDVADFMPFTCATRIAAKTQFSDCTHFSDNTAFADNISEVRATAAVLAGDMPAGNDVITIAGAFADAVTAGQYLLIGAYPGAQLVQIVAVVAAGEPTTLRVRPRLRSTYLFGTVVTLGRVTPLFRLARAVPAVPVTVTGSPGVTVEIEETI